MRTGSCQEKVISDFPAQCKSPRLKRNWQNYVQFSFSRFQLFTDLHDIDYHFILLFLIPELWNQETERGGGGKVGRKRKKEWKNRSQWVLLISPPLARVWFWKWCNTSFLASQPVCTESMYANFTVRNKQYNYDRLNRNRNSKCLKKNSCSE